MVAKKAKNSPIVLAGALATVIAVVASISAVVINMSGGVPQADAHVDAPSATDWVTNDTVYDIFSTADTRYIAGQFDFIGPYTARGAKLDKTTGEADQTNPVTNIGSGQNVLAVESDGSGGWFVGGDFNTVGGVTKNNLYHIKSDGTLNSWDPGLNAAGEVHALFFDSANNKLYVGGQFTQAGGDTNHVRLARYSKSGDTITQDAGWNAPDITGAGIAAVDSIAMDSGAAQLYIAGDFDTFGGLTTRNNFANIVISTAALGSWDPDADNVGRAVEVNGDALYIGGSFTSLNAGADTRGRGALYDISTPASPSLETWNPAFNNTVRAISASGDGSATYFGGAFINYGGDPAKDRIVGFTTDVTAPLTAPSVITTFKPAFDNQIWAIEYDSATSTIYAAGDFLEVDTERRARVVALDPTATVAGNYNKGWNPGAEAGTYAIDVDSTDVYIGGDFDMAGGAYRVGVAAFDIPTNTILDWDVGLNAGGLIRTVEASGSTVYLAGDFTQYGNVPGGSPTACTDVAAFNKTTAAGTWCGASLTGQVYALEVGDRDGNLTDDTLYVGGNFTTISATSRNRLASFDITTPSAPTVTSWNPDASAAGTIIQALEANGTVIYIGGNASFDTIDGTTINGLSAVYTDPSTTATNYETAWLPAPTPATLSVNDFHINGDNLYIGGTWDTIASESIPNLAKFDMSGDIEDPSIVTTWPPTGFTTGVIQDLDFADGQLFVGGGFTLPTPRAFAIDGSTGVVDPWSPNHGAEVDAIDVNGNHIWTGGSFLDVDGDDTRIHLASFTQSAQVAINIVGSVDPNLSFSIDATSLSFGSVSTASVRYATTSGGSDSEVKAHSFTVGGNPNSGWKVTVRGTTPNGPKVIDSYGSGAVPTAGTEGFGMHLEESGTPPAGTSVEPPYDHLTNYAYEATANITDIIATSTGPAEDATYDVFYAMSVGETTPPGDFSTGITFIATGYF